MRSWIPKLAAAVRRLQVSLLERKVKRLYAAYHRSFLDNIHEAQEEKRLPLATLRLKNRLNEAISALRKLDPATRWKLFT